VSIIIFKIDDFRRFMNDKKYTPKEMEEALTVYGEYIEAKKNFEIYSIGGHAGILPVNKAVRFFNLIFILS
jgi:hypothetical protein